MEDALKKFFDELFRQRLFIEDIMGIFDNSGYLNLLFEQSENYENGITDFEIKSRDKNGSDIDNERLQRNTGYIQYINNYENSKFQSNLRQLEKGLSLSATQSSSSNSTLQRKILIYRFREIFHDSAVLYQNNEELYNGTIYEFDNRGIQKQMGTVPKRLYDTDSYGYDPVICKINGKTLLLFSYISAESVTKMNYQIVTYKDITNVLAQNQTLFC